MGPYREPVLCKSEHHTKKLQGPSSLDSPASLPGNGLERCESTRKPLWLYQNISKSIKINSKLDIHRLLPTRGVLLPGPPRRKAQSAPGRLFMSRIQGKKALAPFRGKEIPSPLGPPTGAHLRFQLLSDPGELPDQRRSTKHCADVLVDAHVIGVVIGPQVILKLEFKLTNWL